MKPAPKSAAMAALLSAMCGCDHNATIEADRCKVCGRPAETFRNEISRREYSISGLCQDCQDRVFGKDQDSNESLDCD